MKNEEKLVAVPQKRRTQMLKHKKNEMKKEMKKKDMKEKMKKKLPSTSSSSDDFDEEGGFTVIATTEKKKIRIMRRESSDSGSEMLQLSNTSVFPHLKGEEEEDSTGGFGTSDYSDHDYGGDGDGCSSNDAGGSSSE